MALEM